MSEEITKGSIVVVESRTWPGSNKPGGVARVTAVHNETGIPIPKKKYDVSYVLGGKEKGVEEEYVRLQSSSSSIAGGGGTNSTNLHISTSTASFALSASPLQTPRSIDESTTTRKEESPVNGDEDPNLIDEKRKRKNSIQEDILMHPGSRNSSYNSLGAGKQDMEEQPLPLVKKRKILHEAEAEAETSHDDDSAVSSSSSLHNHHKTAIWSARKHLEIKDKKKSSSTNNINITENNQDQGNKSAKEQQQQDAAAAVVSLKRWRSHQIAEDYISLASAMVLPPTRTATTHHHLNNTFGYTPHLGQYPIEQVTALGYLTSPLRRPTVIEKWSPYEIATFEAALALHGKHFHQVQKWIKTKNTKEVIEFYYIWKKTSHYRRWKSSFCEEMEESVCSSSSGGGGGDDCGVGEEDGMSVVEGKKSE